MAGASGATQSSNGKRKSGPGVAISATNENGANASTLRVAPQDPAPRERHFVVPRTGETPGTPSTPETGQRFARLELLPADRPAALTFGADSAASAKVETDPPNSFAASSAPAGAQSHEARPESMRPYSRSPFALPEGQNSMAGKRGGDSAPKMMSGLEGPSGSGAEVNSQALPVSPLNEQETRKAIVVIVPRSSFARVNIRVESMDGLTLSNGASLWTGPAKAGKPIVIPVTLQALRDGTVSAQIVLEKIDSAGRGTKVQSQSVELNVAAR
jgi:hypothetical protein